MQFFTQLAALNLVGNLRITVQQTPDGKQAVSLLLDNEACTDPAKHQITPLLLTGTAEELDAGFFGAISQPLQHASGLQTNMQAYMQATEAAQKASKAEKDKADAAKKAEDAASKAYNDAMKKVGELREQKKYREAIKALPDPGKFPQHASQIKTQRDKLIDLINGNSSLFGTPTDVADDTTTDEPTTNDGTSTEDDYENDQYEEDGEQNTDEDDNDD